MFGNARAVQPTVTSEAAIAGTPKLANRSKSNDVLDPILSSTEPGFEI